MPDTLRPRCSVCGFSWDWGRDDAIGMVAESPELYALALEDVGGIGAGALAGAADHLWRMVDTLRFGTERLWWLAHDPDATPPAVDAEALARLRPPGSRSVAV
ncbi:MAG TPA: hypothetical protein VMB72_10330, partial [Acidimicrobiales bacterium]|nr:hypothetical protein [Acidimicrobiales bacterium]